VPNFVPHVPQNYLLQDPRLLLAWRQHGRFQDDWLDHLPATAASAITTELAQLPSDARDQC